MSRKTPAQEAFSEYGPVCLAIMFVAHWVALFALAGLLPSYFIVVGVIGWAAASMGLVLSLSSDEED